MIEPDVHYMLTARETEREQQSPQSDPLDRILQNGLTRPGAIAVTEINGESLTYGELTNRVFALTTELHRQGVAQGDLIGILLPRSIDALVSILAVYASGATFMPLDANDRVARLENIIRDSTPARVLVNAETADVLHGRKNLELRVDLAQQSADMATTRVPTRKPSDIAYVVYTSGSTGEPAGVCIPCSALAHHVASVIKSFELCDHDRVLQFAPLCFDVALEEILPALAVGASLILRDDAMANHARIFFQHVEHAKITVLNLPTAFWHHLVHSSAPNAWPGTVRLLVVGGERILDADLQTFRQGRTSHIRFLNGYGPTETTITSTIYDDAWGDIGGETVPIGRPLDGHSNFVLDRHLRPVPLGTIGQLYIGGVGLACGYLRRPELTAQRFVPHPFRPGATLYATGDRVRHTERGNLVFVDRIDNQVKVRGFRIELGEIEACLRRHPKVADAVVVLHRPASGDSELRGFVVPRDETVSVPALRKHVKDALPAHMVPRIVLLEEFPLTLGGKIDRRDLANRPISLDYQDGFPVADADALERELLSLWSDLLQTAVTDTGTNFFEAGGHSLLVLEMLCEVEKRLGRTCDSHSFLRDPTVKGLAWLLAHELDAGSTTSLLCLAQGSQQLRPLFLAPGLTGHSSDYVQFAQALHAEIPVYGIDGPLKANDGHGGYDLATAAGQYAALIRTMQPKGPYAMAGYCAGGIVALAIADALRESGETVDFLGLMDTVAPPASVRVLSPVTSLSRFRRLCRVAAYRSREYLLGPHPFRRVWSRGLIGLTRSLKTHFPKAWPKLTVHECMPDMAGRFSEEEQRMIQLHLDAILAYRLRPAPVDVTLFRTLLDPFEGPHELDLAWGRALGKKVQVERVPGAHQLILKGESARCMARLFDRYLQGRFSSNRA